MPVFSDGRRVARVKMMDWDWDFAAGDCSGYRSWCWSWRAAETDPSGWRVRLSPRSVVNVSEQGGGRWREVQSRKATSDIVRGRIMVGSASGYWLDRRYEVWLAIRPPTENWCAIVQEAYISCHEVTICYM
jgi:hypothetical protein